MAKEIKIRVDYSILPSREKKKGGRVTSNARRGTRLDKELTLLLSFKIRLYLHPQPSD